MYVEIVEWSKCDDRGVAPPLAVASITPSPLSLSSFRPSVLLLPLGPAVCGAGEGRGGGLAPDRASLGPNRGQ